MNTELEKPPLNLPLEILPPAPVPTKLDDAAAVLERQIQAERDERRTERFYWIFGTTLLLDMAILPHVGLEHRA